MTEDSKNENDKDSKLECKVVLLGEMLTGKTSLISRLVDNTFNYNEQTTFVASNYSKEIEYPEKWLQPIDSFFVDLPQLQISPDQFKRVSNGASIKLNTSYAKVALVYNGHIKAIYQRQGKIYRPEMMLLKNE